MDDPADRERLLQRLIEGGSWERAIDVARELVAEDPDNARWHRAAGQCALHLEHEGDAERHLRDALRLAPDDSLALYFLSHALRMAKRPAEAEETLQAAIALNPNDADYWIELGWLAFERDDHTASLRCANKARDLAPNNARARTLAAAAESQLLPKDGGTRGDPEAQIESLHRTLEIDPENDAALHNIGVVYFNELADYHAAERHFRQALSIAPSDPLYQRNLMRSLRRQDPVLRALYAPWRAVTHVFQTISWAWEKRWPLIVGLPLAIPMLAGTLVLALFWAVFMWPPAALYEFLTRPELISATGRLTVPTTPSKSGWQLAKNPQHWPKTARLALFFGAFTGFWLLLVNMFRALAFQNVIIQTLTILLVGWIALGVYACVRECIAARERRGRRRAIDLLDD